MHAAHFGKTVEFFRIFTFLFSRKYKNLLCLSLPFEEINLIKKTTLNFWPRPQQLQQVTAAISNNGNGTIRTELNLYKRQPWILSASRVFSQTAMPRTIRYDSSAKFMHSNVAYAHTHTRIRAYATSGAISKTGIERLHEINVRSIRTSLMTATFADREIRFKPLPRHGNAAVLFPPRFPILN